MNSSRTSRTYAAALTPLTDGGAAPDLTAIAALGAFYASSGVDGVLPLGTTGEGVLLDVAERRAVAEAYISAARGRMDVIVHCGAQTTRDTVALAAHAAERGAGGVAVIAPPYFALDAAALVAHFELAARACAPLPFYLYEFADRSGYAVPPAVIEALRESTPNLTGLKVSDAPWERLRPYLVRGLDVFVGSEPLIPRGLEAGAAGAVAGMAAAFPEFVTDLVRNPSHRGAQAAEQIRAALEGQPFHASLKHILRRRGLPLSGAVRGPLRALTATEAEALDARLPELFELGGIPKPAGA
jgi:dihydrodipicolinate synthase/N-acetylneuraminate lyase